MNAYTADALENLTSDECDAILAEVDAGSRFRVFAWGVHHPEDERPGCPFYLAAPDERLWPQRLWYSLVAAVFPLLFVWNGGIVYLSYFCGLNMTGGRDVTDLVVSRIRRRLRLADEDRTAREFLADLSNRPTMN